MQPDEELDAWYRAAVAETMRPCPEYRNGPVAPHPSIAQIEHHRERWPDDERMTA